MLEIRLLRYFLAAAREENITRASQSLHISQPTLSKQLTELEQSLGKQLLIRGKRKVTLTKDGVLLRKRAEEIVALAEKAEREIVTGSAQLSGEVSIGGNPTMALLKAAAAIRAVHPGVRFQFYGGDAIDVLERLEHGSLDFAVFLQPINAVKYEYISLADSSRWGLLMPSDCALAQKHCVQRQDLSHVPLVFHRRAGLQRLISRWAETDIENLHIAATYNIINGSSERFVKSGLGYHLTTEDLLPSVLDEGICFRPLEPPLKSHYALIWKRYTPLSKAAETFLNTMRAAMA